MKENLKKNERIKHSHRELGGLRIGCGAGFSGDRIEPAMILAEQGKLDYLVLECLAERTIALAQKRKLQDPSKGYDPLLERRIETLLPILVKNKVRLITNMGAANPVAAAKKVAEIAQKLGLKIKVAAVSGDELRLRNEELGNNFQDTNSYIDKKDIKVFGNETFALNLFQSENPPIPNSQFLISMNAYIGIEGILEALSADSQVVITGRVADPSLFLAPMIHEFGWKTDDYELLGKGTIIGHLLECAGQVSGGYFADNYKKTVPDLANLGHPIAEIFEDGTAIISKVEGTGGLINLQTVKEQLLYEVINPNEYFTPDVIANFMTVKLKEIGQNQVYVSGGGGKEKPKTYKVSVGYKAFYLGEGEISYAGKNAFERAKLAGEIIEKRCSLLKSSNRPDGEIIEELKIDYIGINSVFKENYTNLTPPSGGWGAEVRLRVAAKCKTAEQAALIGEEVEALYTNGPAGGGGVRKYVNEVIGIASVLIDREKISPKVTVYES